MKLSGTALICMTLLIFSCSGLQERKLLGKWQGASIMEDGMPMPISPSEIGFEFFGNGYYNYRSTLNYKEVGSYEVKDHFLFTMDTLNEASSQKIVQILNLSDDSLKLKMNNQGKEQILSLAKIKR